MKSLILALLGGVTTAAMAVMPVDPSIVINGTSSQTAGFTGTSVHNTSGANNTAQQNVASNSGNVTIRASGTSIQTVYGSGGTLSNEARGADAYASQNVSSNMGDVTIAGTSTQSTYLTRANVRNLADGRNSKAVQNIASNNACQSCNVASYTGPR